MNWENLATVGWGFLGGLAGWAATTFLAQPLTAAFVARSEAAQSLAKFEVCDWFEPLDEDRSLPTSEETLFDERQRAYVDCGAKLVGFDLSYPWFAPLLGLFGFKLRAGGNHMIWLGRLPPGNRNIRKARDDAMIALRLGRRIGRSALRR